MSPLRFRALAGVCVLMGASGLAASGHAETYIYGGGSSLIAPAWAQAIACWSTDASVNQTTHGLYTKGVSASTPQASFVTVTAPTLSPTACSPVSQTYSVNLDSTGAGTGQVSVFAHDAIIGVPLGSSGQVIANTVIAFGSRDGDGISELFPSIQYGLSDNPLVDSDVGVYQVGTGANYTPPDGTGAITTPASYLGATFTSAGSAHNGGTGSTLYPVPSTLYGPLVQFPVAIVPVALAYNPKYENESGQVFSLHVKTSLQNADGSGGLNLSAAAYCAMFTGVIVDWNDPTLTSLNGGQSLKDPSDTGLHARIMVVGATDASGETSIFTRNLAAVCGNSSTFGSAGTLTLPASITGMANFLGGTGGPGVAAAINSHPGAIGYLGADYALPAVTNTGANTYGLNVADVQNATSSAFVEPTGATALTAFGTLSPPSTGAAIKDPTMWVQSTSKTATLANPKAGYPITGTTNFLGYTCYASASSVTAIQKFVTFEGGTQGKEILTNAALAQLPSAWLTAISNNFLAPTSTTSAYNVFLALMGTGKDGKGDGYTNANCTPGTIMGG